jgi:outer membrane protein W
MRPFLGIALLTLLGGSSHAETPSLGIQGGVGLPTGEFSDAWDRGTTIGLCYTFGINREWGIGADASYLRSDPSEAHAQQLEAAGSDAFFSYVQCGVHARWWFPVGSDQARPYLEAGPGIYVVREELQAPTGSETESQTTLGLRGGGGIDIAITDRTAISIAGVYHHVMTEPDGLPHDTTPYFSLTGGLRFRLGAY